MSVQKPVILRQGDYTKAELEELKTKKTWIVKDIYEQQLAELFEIDNPSLKQAADFKKMQTDFIHQAAGEGQELKGDWIYFPWSGTLIHSVGQTDYQRLRTNRNQLLIRPDEQAKLADFKASVAGLSVGGGMAVSLAYLGVGNFRLADADSIETANLNRLRSGIQHIGDTKVQVAAQQIYEINPYAEITAWTEGIDQSNVKDFIAGAGVVFDEIDDFEMKIRLRLTAQRAGVPVIMLTSLGDSVLIDVERYDIDPHLKLFNGLLGSLPEDILAGPIGEKEKIKYAMQIVGPQYVPVRALESLAEINKSLVGRPQLYSTIAVDGGWAAYLVRRLALGQALPSGRQLLSFDEVMDLKPDSETGRQATLDKLKDVTE